MAGDRDAQWEAVFFDIGGVILDLESVQAGHRTFTRELAERYGVDPERALETWQEELGRYFGGREGSSYRVAREGYARAVEAIVGETVPEAEWMPLFEQATREELEPVDGVVETIEGLAGSVYLGIISDIDTWEAERLLASFGVAASFDHMTTSEEVGYTKPHPAMFETALEKADVDPSRSIHVGDRYEHDMQGASRAGIATVAHGGSAATGPEDDEPDADAETGASPDGGSEDRPLPPAADYRVSDIRELRSIVRGNDEAHR